MTVILELKDEGDVPRFILEKDESGDSWMASCQASSEYVECQKWVGLEEDADDEASSSGEFGQGSPATASRASSM